MTNLFVTSLRITSKLVIPFLLFCVLLTNTSALCSAEVLAQKPVLAVESTPSATSSASPLDFARGGSVQVSNLPAVRILPDNPLYFLKTLKEKVQLLVTRNTSDQATLLLNFSQKRLAEALKVAEKGKPYISEKLLDVFGKDIEAAQQKINQAKMRGEQTRDLFLKLQETVAYQKSVVEKLGIEIDQTATPSAVTHGRIQQGLGIFDWLRSLFGKKEILKPLAE